MTKAEGGARLLETLFADRPAAELMEHYLRGQWLSCHGALDRVPELADAARQAQPADVFALIKGNADAFHITSFGMPVDLHGLDNNDAKQLYDNGWTVLCRDVDESMTPLQRIRCQLTRALGAPDDCARASIFLSPPHAATGLDKHFDHFDSIVVQLAGSKTWQIAANRCVSYPSHTHFAAEPVAPLLGQYLRDVPARQMPPHTEQVDMVPGTALLLPRGTWHRTSQVGAEGSVSVSFMLWPATFETLLASILPLWFVRSEKWRKPLLGLMSSPELRSEAEQTALECLNELRAALHDIEPAQLLELYAQRRLLADSRR